ASNLESFVTNFDSAVQALKQLQISDLTDFILLHLALQRLDSDTIKFFEITHRKNTIPSYNDLVVFVKEQAKVLSRSINNNSAVTSRQYKSFPQPKTTKSFVNTEM
ncbi:hypothetical protein Cfor_03481, partial [Coptotermes formosanus]